MEELGSWRYWVWWAGLLVAAAVGAYTGSHRPAKPSSWLLVLGGIASMTLASIPILTARVSLRRKAVRLTVSAAVFALLAWTIYYVQDPYAGGWGAIGG